MSVTTIEWTKRPGTIGETWNPTTGCNKVDRGCKNCYAEIMHRRLQAMGQPKYAQDFLKGAVEHRDALKIPLRWKSPRTVFVDSMSDLFHENISFEFLRLVFIVIGSTPEHTYLILTKRPERAVEFFEWMDDRQKGGLSQTITWRRPPNVWMGTSVDDQDSADLRIPVLLSLAGVRKFLSYEPATGPVNLTRLYFSTLFIDALQGSGRLDWVIAGGESGPKAIASNPNWFRKVRDDCKQAGVPFFFKQWGRWRPEPLSLQDYPPMVKTTDKSYNVLDGQIWQQFPEPKPAR